LFDLGVKRALERTARQEIRPRTYGFGRAFEHFIVTEIHRLNDYFRRDWRLSFLRTKDGLEVDLVLERPGFPTAFVEIKSSERMMERDVAPLNRFLSDTKAGEGICLSLDPHRKKIGRVHCFPWREGLRELGLGRSE
jgi:predicted AAA+ superfamily ATPase